MRTVLHSSVGRAEDCSCYMVVLRSLVQIQFVGSLFGESRNRIIQNMFENGKNPVNICETNCSCRHVNAAMRDMLVHS